VKGKARQSARGNAAREAKRKDFRRGSVPSLEKKHGDVNRSSVPPGEKRSAEKRPQKGVAALTRLKEGLTGERSLIGASYMDDPAMLRAYLEYYWPVSRAQAERALFVAAKNGSASFRKVIDAGSGPGPVAAAFAGTGARELSLVDQSRRALELAVREIGTRCNSPVTVSVCEGNIASPVPDKIRLWGEADCVSFGHSLNEVFSDDPDRIAKRADLLASWSSALSPDGVILVIEPALLSTSRDLLAVRDLLVERGWSVVAPCPGRARLPCPALAAGTQHTCHEDVIWQVPPSVSALAESLKVDKEFLKMTWFVFVPPRADGSPVSPLTPGQSVCRVVSEAMLNKGGRLRRLACDGSGRYPFSVAQDSPDALRCSFADLRRGEYVRIENPERRENGIGIGPETKLERLY
jgi:SAM-dependent methyltransferase